MRKFLTFLSIQMILSGHFALAQSVYSPRSNSRFDADAKKYVIEYDLNRNRPFKVKVDISANGKQLLNPSVVGDVNNCIEGGNGKRISWYCFKDIPDFSPGGSDVQIKVIASQHSNYRINAITGAALIGVASIGMVYPGLKNYYRALNDYDFYASNRYPGAVVWQNQSRADFFESASSNYLKSQYLMISGGVMILAGAGILINRAIKIKKLGAKDCTMHQKIDFEPVICSLDNAANLGLRLNF
jgi:hypothetical protein